MQEEKLAEIETEEKSKGIINSIIPFGEIKENKFLEELGDANMMEGLEDIEEFMAKQNITKDEKHGSKGSNAQGACHILLTDEEMENLGPKAKAELEFPPGFDYNGKPTRVEMAEEQPCSVGEDVTDQEIGKEWFDDYIIEPQIPNIVEKPVSNE
nr:hypothetical protein CFP56_34226 [Quercus suber]